MRHLQKEVPVNPLNAEFLLSIFEEKISVKVLKSNDTWYGMTYKGDVAAVKDSFREMLEKELYREELFSDL